VETASTASSASATATANPAAECGHYTGPAATISYAIWGDTTELANQQKIVDAFMAKNPSIKVKVTVADWDTYWDKLQTSLAGGNAPDVFVMDGPLFPDYQTRDQLLDLSPLIARDGFDTSQLADPRGEGFHGPRRPPVRPAARSEHHRPLLQQDDVRSGRHPVPG
jgi:ABC-type glycerol-3-phosphate transport system substrate-binding protein